MEESFPYQKASASSDEDMSIEPVKNAALLAKPKKDYTDVSSSTEDSEEDVPIAYLKSQINLKEENVTRSNLRPKINLIKEEYHGISHNFDSEDGGPVSNPEPEIAIIKVEYDNISFHTDSEADLSISNLRPETCLIKEEYDDFSVNTETNLMKEGDDTQTGNKQDFIAEADSNTDDEEGEVLNRISLNFDSEDDGPISNPKPEMALIKVEYDNISFHTDSEADLSIPNLRPETCLIKEEYDAFSFNPETNLMKDDDDTHTSNKKDFVAEANCNTDDEEGELLTYVRLKKPMNIDGDGDDNSTNTENDNNYENESDNGNISDYEPKSDNSNSSDYEPKPDNSNSSDYEPESKRPHLMVPELGENKKTHIKCSRYIYDKLVIRQCPKCEYEFNSANSWKKHLTIMHHLEKPEHLQFKYCKDGAKCKLCDFQTTTPRFYKLLHHEITHMPYSNYLKCKLCDWKTKRHENIRLHLSQQHAESIDVATKSVELTVCLYCHQEFSSYSHLRRHMTRDHTKSIDSRTLFLCLECDQEFTSKASLCEHVFEKFSKYTTKELRFEVMPPEGDKSAYLKCTQCQQIFRKIEKERTQIKIREHYMLHLGEPSGKLPYKCKYCPEGCRRYEDIPFHACEKLRDLLHKDVESMQDLPRKPAACKKVYMKHIRYVCLKCGISYSLMFHCKKHMFRKHGMNKPAGLDFKSIGTPYGAEIYECITCEEFTCDFDLNAMLLHARSHATYNPFQCKRCQMTFVYDTDIPGHQCVDEECAETLKARLQGSNITTCLPLQPVPFKKDYMKHIRHVCLKCGISFSQIWRCKKHMFEKHGLNNAVGLDFKSIDGTEEYECMVCEKFTCNFDLNTMLVHARSHAMYKQFQCKLCKMTFVYDADIPGHQCVDEEYAKPLNETRPPKGNSLENMEHFCPKCGQRYSSWTCLRRHLRKVHGMDDPYSLGFEVLEKCDNKNATIYNCTECIGFTITDKDLKAMFEHARQHLPYTSFRCTLCSEQFQFKDEAEQHQCTVNDTTKDDDDAVASKANLMNKIIERLNKVGRFCPKCGKKFSKTNNCKRHIKKQHGFDRPDKLGFEKILNTAESSSPSPSSVTYRCMDCIQFTLPHPDISAMLEHAREHLPFDSFWCMLCEKRFRLRSEAKLHRCGAGNKKDVENAAPLRCPKTFEKCIKKFCPECNNEMLSVHALYLHMTRYHEMNSLEGLQMKQTNGNLVECLVCQVHITYKRRYEHRFSHLAYKPFQCKFCAEYFVENDKARMHCTECKLIPREVLEESDEQREEATTVKRRVARHTEVKKVDVTKESNKESEDITDDENDEAMTCEESRHKSKIRKRTMQAAQESDSATLGHKGKLVVLKDEKCYSKFVRISCPICPDTEFKTKSALSQHFLEIHNSFHEHFTIHNTNAANCKTCNKYFNDVYCKRIITRHYLKEINGTCYSCRLCGKSFLYFKTMHSHLLNEHGAVIAGTSESTAASSNSISAAKTTAVTTPITAAIVADGSLADSLKIAAVDIAKLSRTTMAIPTDKTVAFNEFNAYISYACPECNKDFKTSEQWHLHINFEHNFFDLHQLNIEATSDGYKRCRQCNVNIYGGVLGEQRHKLTHMPFKSFICTLCLHRSTTIGVLTQHFRRCHFTKGEFKCILCEEVLSTSCEQIEHIKNVHDPSEYPRTMCRVCFDQLSSADGLRKHMERHNPNRVVFQCKFCVRSYNFKRDLRWHMKAKHQKSSRRYRKGR